MIELYDKLGRPRPRSSYTDPEVETLNARSRRLFEAAHQAEADLIEVEAASAELSKEAGAISHRAADLRTELDKLRPPVSFMDEWRATLKGQPARKAPAKVADEIARVEAELRAAEADLLAMRDRVIGTQKAIPKARQAVATAWREFMAAHPIKSRDEATKDYVKTSTAEREAAKQRVFAPQRFASVLDAHLAGGRGSPGTRHPRQAQRGAYPRHAYGQRIKLPSEQ